MLLIFVCHLFPNDSSLISCVLYGVSSLSLIKLLISRRTTFHNSMLLLFLGTHGERKKEDNLSSLIACNKEDDSCHVVQ